MKIDEYDFVIVGAGSAGCVVAEGLSRDPSVSVLLLEAGPIDRNVMIQIPAGVYRAFRNKRINWNYVSEPEAGLNGRRIPTPRGRVVGGSSSINSMVYMRGHPDDFNRWERDHGLAGWGYADCLPYFKAAESYDQGANDWRGNSGLLKVTRTDNTDPLFDVFLEAGAQAGQGASDDLNGQHPEGVARYDATKSRNRRCSAATAYLTPALRRPNLKMQTGAHVEKLEIRRHRVEGVTFQLAGEHKTVRAKREVVLCGGAINSPQLLMLSGIGPADHLRDCGIQVLADLPGVGQNLRDHAKIKLQFACRKRLAFHRIGNPLVRATAGVQWALTGQGIATSNIWEAGGLIRSNDDVSHPNLQYHFGPLGFTVQGDRITINQAFSVNVDHARPRTKGYIELNRTTPRGPPRLHFNYLADPDDLREMGEGVLRARELVAQPAFDEFRGAEMTPGADCRTSEDIEAMLRERVETAFHPSCTCRMGHDGLAVVDNKFRVHGIEALRVVDASVLPEITSANLNAPTMMIAARAVDFMRSAPQLKPMHEEAVRTGKERARYKTVEC
ncbi:GMC family oxidoreductase [Ruegeria atlantica]|uniref:GMC family oxidoreductase n=1 Tax=Ruegeria atlantica TaxID=81569 RepID=UPI001580AFD6|nr:choline dehydrogenase [Ruegeria atlantica]